MQLHFKEKKKKEAAGRFGGEGWEFKVNSESFLFFLSFFFFFFWKAVKCRERISGRISPPSQPPLRDFWEKLTAHFLRTAGGIVEGWGWEFRGPGNVFWKRHVRSYILKFGGKGWQ